MEQVFEIAPAGGKALMVLGAVGVLTLALTLMFAYVGLSSRATRFVVDDHALAVRGTLYGREIPRTALDVDRARVVSLARERPLQPKRRRNGMGIPGYQIGWFRLNNDEKALAFLTREDRVAYVPTHDGYSLLLSAKHPEALVDALRRGPSKAGS